MREGFRLGRVLGIDVYLDWSLLIIFGLITTILGTGIFPSWHPDWGLIKIWLTAVMTAVLFFVSILMHEMAHGLVGRRLGAKIPRITLFVFGGMAHTEREPDTWKGEFWMAIVGPITSLIIGFACLYLAGATAGIEQSQLDDPQQMLRNLGAFSTLLLWLGPVNIFLGLFNLVPGFPLDGGRVFRAIIWGITGNLDKATRIAAGLGQAFGWLLMAMGFAMILGIQVPLFGSGLVGGLWLALIGWFLNNAAARSFEKQVMERSLDGVEVSSLMQTHFLTMAPDTPVKQLIDEYLLENDQRAFPIMEHQTLRGLVCLADLQRLRPEDRQRLTAADVMTPRERLVVAQADDDATSAMDKLYQANVNQLPVLRHQELVGLLTRERLMTWLSLHASQGSRQAQPGR